METKRKKMSIQERAKQFMPFSPLNGLKEALKKKEDSMNKVDRPVLSEDLKSSIDLRLKELERLITDSSINKAQISFFDSGKKALWTGSVLEIDKQKRKLLLDNHSAINIEDILDLQIL